MGKISVLKHVLYEKHLRYVDFNTFSSHYFKCCSLSESQSVMVPREFYPSALEDVHFNPLAHYLPVI